jgi:hypothetical protein
MTPNTFKNQKRDYEKFLIWKLLKEQITIYNQITGQLEKIGGGSKK